jgi:hypothetical protein
MERRSTLAADEAFGMSRSGHKAYTFGAILCAATARNLGADFVILIQSGFLVQGQ